MYKIVYSECNSYMHKSAFKCPDYIIRANKSGIRIENKWFNSPGMIPGGKRYARYIVWPYINGVFKN